MKLQAVILSLLASTGLATPLRRDISQALYTLRLTSYAPFSSSSPFSPSLNPLQPQTNLNPPTRPSNSPVTSLNGLYLTAAPNATTLTTTSPQSQSPADKITFYPVLNPTTGLSELHTGASTTLAVVGANGLLDLSSLADPAAAPVPAGTTVDWTSFRLEAQGSREEGTVKYAGEDGAGQGRWVVFPSLAAGGGGAEEWSVKWKDVNAWTTENYMPVQVVYELVKDE
ncbi:hypothetical protein NEMBOFW57_002973 [Staphylotrichum longicolle]|uniref:Uncharacterized protein n=1 Tax=Staphylotrichum longicolle TaxID=669026 RepID=A0AAD4F907_9PEZI|nr:hypothetical protein NEMBOFW57_002973 [Staphylotrichum longicolle]